MFIYKDFLTIFKFSNGKEIVNRYFEQSDDDIKQLCNLFNGIKNCYSSVNYYYKNGETRIPIIEKAFFDIDDSPEDTRKLVDYLLEENIRFELFFSGQGHHVYLTLKGKGNSQNLRILQYHILHQSGANADMHCVGDAFRVSRIPNTLNLSANKFCIPIKVEEIGCENADKQRFERFVCGEKILDLSSFIEDSYSYIKENIIKDVKINSEVILLPCIKNIVKKLNPTHTERFVLACYLSDAFRNGGSLFNFDKNGLCEKVLSFIIENCSHWLDFDRKITKYFIWNIVPKFDVNVTCDFIVSKNCCVGCRSFI